MGLLAVEVGCRGFPTSSLEKLLSNMGLEGESARRRLTGSATGRKPLPSGFGVRGETRGILVRSFPGQLTRSKPHFRSCAYLNPF